MKGRSPGNFVPQAPSTRGEVVSLLARLSGQERETPTSAEFPDVPVDSWYAADISWANKNGVAIGYGKDFKPDQALTRQEICAILVRYIDNIANIDLPSNTAPVQYSDTFLIHDYAKPFVSRLQQAGIIVGKTENYVAPLDDSRRAEVAVIIDRVMKLAENIN